MDLLALLALAAFGIFEFITRHRAKVARAEAKAEFLREELDAVRWARTIDDLEAAEEMARDEMLAEENRQSQAWGTFSRKWNPGPLARFRLRLIYGSPVKSPLESCAWNEFLKTDAAAGHRSKIMARRMALSRESELRNKRPD